MRLNALCLIGALTVNFGDVHVISPRPPAVQTPADPATASAADAASTFVRGEPIPAARAGSAMLMGLIDSIRSIWTLASWAAKYIGQVGAGRKRQH